MRRFPFPLSRYFSSSFPIFGHFCLWHLHKSAPSFSHHTWASRGHPALWHRSDRKQIHGNFLSLPPISFELPEALVHFIVFMSQVWNSFLQLGLYRESKLLPIDHTPSYSLIFALGGIWTCLPWAHSFRFFSTVWEKVHLTPGLWLISNCFHFC